MHKSLSTTSTSIFPFQFSICSIITDMEEYAIMKQSFEACGFTNDCEYIIADNTDGNKFDAYVAINRFIRESTGKYLIIVHQDIRCIDGKEVLVECLNTLSMNDSKWAVSGNAGSMGYNQLVYHINNAGKIIKNANLPAKVISLDENFLVINKATSIAISSDLSGFHLYGTDICIIADILGYNSYVIPFMLKHLSYGNVKELDKHVNSFVYPYGSKIRSRFIQTTCTKFYLSNSILKNKIYNYPFIFFLVKALQGFKLLFKVNRHKKAISYE
jgi:hypothetical protein